MKTRLDILTDIEDELCVRLPINILPSDVSFNDKWYSEEEIKDKISATTIKSSRYGHEGYIDAELLKIALFGE